MTERLDAKRVLGVGAVGGALAGMMMAAVEMLYGWASDSRTFWDAPMAIWAWVAGLDWFGEPGDHVGSIILGAGGHMMNSMIVGVIFATIMSALALRGLAGSVVLGVGYGLVLWVIMRYGILPLNDPESTLFTTDRVSPQWVWWLAHAALGMTAGIVYHLATRRSAVAPAEMGRVHEAPRRAA